MGATGEDLTEVSSEFEKSPVSSDRDTKGRRSTCMGNNTPIGNSNLNEYVQETEMHWEPGSPSFGTGIEREKVGPKEYVISADPREPANYNPQIKDNRTNFITIQNKCRGQPKSKAHHQNIPDLNQEVEDTNNSDPFNVNEIFGMEAQETRGIKKETATRLIGDPPKEGENEE
ncbi:hypothetical protein Hanom_Chr05g00421251 [Helianthus anomalus]